MNLGEALYSHLTVYPSLAALISTRVYPQRLPQRATLPAVKYQQVSRRPVHVRTGRVNPIVQVRMQFDVYGSSYSAVDAVATELKKALYAFRPLAPPVLKTFVADEIDLVEPDLDQVRRSVDALIWYTEE